MQCFGLPHSYSIRAAVLTNEIMVEGYDMKIIIAALITLILLSSMIALSEASDDSSCTAYPDEINVPYAGTLYAIRVPGIVNKTVISTSQAIQIAKKHRWIYINASCKTPSQATREATLLSDAVGGPLVLVYMPRHIGDEQRNTYNPDFVASLRALMEGVDDNINTLLSARSYGVHQTLHVIREHFDSPYFLLTGIATAFGAYGNWESDNVDRYIEDVEMTQSKFCMIASTSDGFTWRRGGSAYEREGGTCRGDPNVCDAVNANSENVTLFKLEDANHSPVTEYLDHGLVQAMHDCADHFDMELVPFGGVPKAWLIPQMLLHQ